MLSQTSESSSLQKQLQLHWESVVKEKNLHDIFSYWQPVQFKIPDSEKTQEAYCSIQDFLSKKESGRVLLISGESGSGKSTLARYLVNNPINGYVPIYIELTSLKEITKSSFKEWIEACANTKTSEEEIKKVRWLLVLDGYDELSPELKEKNIYKFAELWRYDVTVIITSRPSAIPNDISSRNTQFSPCKQQKHEHDLPVLNANSLMQYDIAPFTHEMQKAYLEKCWENVIDKNVLLNIYEQLPDLMLLAERPFILWLLSEELPAILKEKKTTQETLNIEQLRITQQTLYDSFIKRWLTKHYVRLTKHHTEDITETSWTYDDFLADAKAYMNRLAYTLYRLGKTQFKQEDDIQVIDKPLIGQTKKEVNVIKNYGSVQSIFSSSSTVRNTPKLQDTLTELGHRNGYFQRTTESTKRPIKHLIAACPLISFRDGTYEFLHKSLLEHCTLDKLLNGPSLSATIGLGCNLNEVSIIDNHDLLQEAAKRLKDNKELQDILFEVVRGSRHEAQLATAAANAITLLNVVDFNFSRKDLRRIRIKGANLSHALCANADFTEADLREVNFSQACLQGAKFDRACLDDAQMGELPYIALKGRCSSTCYSPDGKWLAATEDENIVLYEAKTQQRIRVFEGHISYIRSVAFSPNGASLASGSTDKTLRLWDAKTGKMIKILEGHTNWVESVCFSPDGKLIASAGYDNTLRLWDVNTGQIIKTIAGHKGIVDSVTFSPDGLLIASTSRHNNIKFFDFKIWDTKTGWMIRTLEGHTSDINSVSFSPNGALLASGNDDNTLRLWDVKTGQTIKTLTGHTDHVRSVSFSPDGALIASGSSDETLRLWDVSTGEMIKTLVGHTNQVNNVAFSKDGALIASGSHDKTLRLWDVNTGKTIKMLEGHATWGFSASFSPGGALIASESDDKTLRLWDAKTGQTINMLEGHTSDINSVSFSPNGALLASGNDDNTLRLWDVKTGQTIKTLTGHTDHVRSVSFSPDGALIASGSSDETLRLWDVSTGEMIKTLVGHTNQVNNVAFSKDGALIASGGGDKTLRLWDVKTGQMIKTLTGHTNYVGSVSFSPDGALIASGGGDKTLRLWDASTGETIKTLEGHTNSIISVSFSPDGALIASASFDKTLRLWDANTRDCVLTLPFLDIVYSVVWNRNSQFVVGSGKTISLWSFDKKTNKATLEWIKGPHELMLQESSIHEATGLLTLNAANQRNKPQKTSTALLFEQRGAIGQLSSYSSEDVLKGRNEQYVYEKPIKPLLWKNNNFLLTPNHSCVVAMLRNKRQGTNNEHVFLLIESVDKENEDMPAIYRFRRAELFLDETFSHTQICGEIIAGKSKITFNEKSVFDIEMLVSDCEYVSFLITRKQMEELMGAIENDTNNPPGYVLTGNGSLLNQGLSFFSQDKKRHSCLTWCEEKLWNINIEAIKKQKSWLDGFIAVSSRHLPPRETLKKIEIEPTNYKCSIM
ncbi:MAG: Tol-Pal system protein TolB [Legionellaceae bacterium]